MRVDISLEGSGSGARREVACGVDLKEVWLVSEYGKVDLYVAGRAYLRELVDLNLHYLGPLRSLGCRQV